jgi:hypothetical protein
MRTIQLALGVLLALCVSRVARAQSKEDLPETSTDLVTGSRADQGLNRSFLFLVDPSLPAPGHVIAAAGLGSVTRSGEARPIGAGPLLPTLSAEVGVLPWLSLYVEGEMALEATPSGSTTAGIEAGAHVRLTAPGSPVRVALQGSFGRDLSGANKVLLDATVAGDLQALRLALALTVAHDFEEDADAVDVTMVAAASYQLPAHFRLGGELVAQDLEEVANPEAEHGATAFAGPTLSWELVQRLQIVAGPMFGLTTGSPAVLARAVASVLF